MCPGASWWRGDGSERRPSKGLASHQSDGLSGLRRDLPRLSGTITDEAGNSASVVSVTAGDLDGLEQPQRMRTSLAGAFPDGRALILENPEGFQNPAVFRKSPHILNLSRTGPFGFDGRTADLQAFTVEAVRRHFPRTLAQSFRVKPDFACRCPTNSPRWRHSSSRRNSRPAAIRTSSTSIASSRPPHRIEAVRFSSARQVFLLPRRAGARDDERERAGTGRRDQRQTQHRSRAHARSSRPGTDNLPCEPSVGACGTRAFSVPSLFNVANNAPFFHDGSAANLLDAVSFYNTAQFGGSPAAIANRWHSDSRDGARRSGRLPRSHQPSRCRAAQCSGCANRRGRRTCAPIDQGRRRPARGGEPRRCVRPNRGWYTADRDDDREWPVRADRPRACAGWP